MSDDRMLIFMAAFMGGLVLAFVGSLVYLALFVS